MARLVIYSGGTVNRTVELTGHNLRIGRAKGNDVVLFDPAQAVSRFHAELRYENGRYILLDLNSANGTWVSDHRVQRIVFNTGTVAEIGDYRLVLEADPDETTAPPTFSADVESRRALASKAVSGTLVISAIPTPPEPAPPAVGPPVPVSPAPVPHAPVPHAPVPPPPVPPTPVPPTPVPPAPLPPPAAPPPSEPAAAANSPSAARPAGVQSVAGPTVKSAGGSSLSSRLARQPRALVVATVAIGLLVVGVIGIIVGGAFLPSSPDEAQKRADDRPAATQKTTATPAGLPSSQAPAAAESPVAAPLVAAPPVTARRAAPPATVPRAAPQATAPRAIPAPPVVPAPPAAYSEAMAALQANDFTGAITLFERLEKEQPGLLDVPARLAEARGGLRDSRRAAAQASLAAAVGAEQRGDFVEAQKEYQRALDADPACGAVEALLRVRAQMKTLGDAALKRAKQFDAMSRTEDAIAQYERAFQLLPPDDPNRKVAKERLDALRAPFIKQPSR